MSECGVSIHVNSVHSYKFLCTLVQFFNDTFSEQATGTGLGIGIFQNGWEYRYQNGEVNMGHYIKLACYGVESHSGCG